MATNISTIYINASKQKVWETLTQPRLVKQWQFGSDLITDWKIGSPITFTTVWECKAFEQWGTVLAVAPNELLQYNLFAPRPELEDIPENYFSMSYVVTDGSNQTKLEIIQEDNRRGAVQETPQGEENPVLQSLKQVAENL